MKRTTKIALGVGAALGLGLAAAMVSAQGYGPGMGYGMGGGGHMGGYGPQGMMGYGYGPGMGYGPGRGYAGPGAAADGRLADLKTQLNITAKQESSWKVYADQVKAQVDAMQTWHTAMWNSAQLSAPERLAQRDAMMKQRLAQHEAMTAAFKDLYAALSPEQRAIADQGYLAMGPGPRGPGGPGARFR
ncbi:MAG: Spy/CpxP family protein refolding chaperone [Burkholderiales bacterium]